MDVHLKRLRPDRAVSPRRTIAIEHAAESPTADHSTDRFHRHVGDLIGQLRQWSMQLDRRESEMDQREENVNRLLRLLRQGQ